MHATDPYLATPASEPSSTGAGAVGAIVALEASVLCWRRHGPGSAPCEECTDIARWAVARFADVWAAGAADGGQGTNPYQATRH